MGFRTFFNFTFSLTLIYLLFEVVPTAYDVFVKCSTFMAAMWMSEWLMTSTRKYLFYKKVESEGKAVLITGCDSGFGYQLAKRMDRLGYSVFAACLDPTGQGALNLTDSCSSRILILPLDVTSDRSVLSAKDCVEKKLGSDVLWAVVNNSGISQGGEIDWTPMEELQRVFEVNTLGTIRVSKAFLPLLKKSRGRLVNNTSACGKFICPGFVGYCASKSAAIAFTTGLRIEMMKWGVKSISVEPFFYRTPLTEAQSTGEVIEKTWRKADPQIQKEYGESYLENFKESSRQLLNRSSSRVHEVIDCFEDAITAKEPLSTYFPAYLPDKIGIKILQSLPNVVVENYQRYQLERGVKPASLIEN